MRWLLLLASMVLLVGGCSAPNGARQDGGGEGEGAELGVGNLAYRWATIALAAMARDTDRNRPRPPIGARMLALPMIA